MRRWLAAALLVALVAPSGASATEARLTEALSASFPDRAFVLTLPERRDLAVAEVDVRENGKAVSDLRVLPGDEAGSRTFGVVLAIDASESMHGAAIRDAMEAARAFAATREERQQLGVVLFSRNSATLLEPTTDGRRIAETLARTPALSKGTRIYDAGMAAVELLREARVRAGSVVILSDGADVGSAASEALLARAARRARVRIFTVGLESSSFSPVTLASLADAAAGEYSQADSGAALKAIYAELGEQLARQYLVTYRSLAPAATTVEVVARVRGLDTASATYTTPALAAAAELAGDPGQGLTLTALLAALAVAGLLGLAAFAALRRPRRPVGERIASYTGHDRPAFLDLPPEQRTTAVSRLTERLLRRARWWPRFVQEVEVSGIGVRPAQLAWATVLATAVVVWLLAALGRPVGAVTALCLPLVMRAVVRARSRRVRRAFADQLPDNLQVIASAMRAGHSFEGGLAVAAEDAAEPMRAELRKVVSDERLGVPVDEAMSAVAIRMQSPEFAQIGTILLTQREAGGNVAQLLDRTVEGLRERSDLRRLVTSLTAQGRFSGVVVTTLPLGAAFFLSVVQPGYFDPMLDSSTGRLLLITAVGMVGCAWLFIRRIVDIKV